MSASVTEKNENKPEAIETASRRRLYIGLQESDRS